MHQVSIQPQWSIRSPAGEVLPARVIELLVDVQEHGSLLAACRQGRVSYRHAWELIRQGEALFGAPLLLMERGKGSSLTALADKLVWADRRIAARLSPVLDTLASELEVELQSVLSTRPDSLRIHASHGFAVATLHERLAAAEVPVELKYCSSVEAVASLHDGGCELAGFHVPMGEFEARTVAHYARWLEPASHRLIHLAMRRQGLMVAAGNPRKIYEVGDLARPGVRFINRQPGSGTRFLLDRLIEKAGLTPARIAGYEQGEYTHAAVAAYVASGMADVGFGLETPTRQFKLDFLPLQTERYFLLCHERSLELPHVQQALAVVAGDEFRVAVNAMPGYEAQGAGRVMTLSEAFVKVGASGPGAGSGGTKRRAAAR
ncbi:MAG TPA: substrate-binding domain-containing protein [Ideonella sp.]|nr:substrate-binding domain-containing protein [Ideonella sp.]